MRLTLVYLSYLFIIAPLWKSGAILELPCSSVILWLRFCHSVTFQMKIFITLFSGTVRHRRLKLHTWTVVRCIVYTGIRLLLLIRPFIFSFFFLSNFQTLKVFVTLFSGTVRPRRLKFGTHVDSGQMYRVHRNQSAAAYSSLYFSLSFLSNFQTLKFFVTLF